MQPNLININQNNNFTSVQVLIDMINDAVKTILQHQSNRIIFHDISLNHSKMIKDHFNKHISKVIDFQKEMYVYLKNRTIELLHSPFKLLKFHKNNDDDECNFHNLFNVDDIDEFYKTYKRIAEVVEGGYLGDPPAVIREFFTFGNIIKCNAVNHQDFLKHIEEIMTAKNKRQNAKCYFIIQTCECHSLLRNPLFGVNIYDRRMISIFKNKKNITEYLFLIK